MTTICCDLSNMASDSLASDGATSNAVQKIWRIRKQLVGIAGAYADCCAFITWLKAGGDGDDAPDFENVSALVLNGSGIWVYDGHPMPFKVKDGFCAVGSGAQAAMAGLHMGLTPKEAVRIAAKIDPATGGRTVGRKL